MTIKDLIEELQKLDQNAEIGLLDTDWNSIDPINIEQVISADTGETKYYIS